MPRTGVFLLPVVLLMMFGCAPQVDVAAEQAAIEQALSDWLVATNKPGEEGAEGHASFFTEDAVLLPPNTARVEGRDAIRAWGMPSTSAEDFSINWTATSIAVSAGGDLAYATGTYELSLKDAEGNTVSDNGKFLDVWKKQADGSWKVVAGAFNSDLPLPAAAAPEEK